uniref:Outer membrane protein OmpA n=1 Tax=Candidatus Kentrum sp. TC TaxID=2126339 RepID=A0A450ZVB2_9GAMM|nr:MAG: Outer membrane protein OmpA [Candidatus Kentron sp. TC]
MIYSRKPSTVIAKQRLSLIGAVVCLVLGVAASVSHGVWFTHVMSSSGGRAVCPEFSTSIPAASRPPVETKASYPVAVSAGIRGEEMGASPKTTIAAVENGPVVSVIVPPLPLPSWEGLSESDAEDDKNGQRPKQPSSSGAGAVVTVTEEGPGSPNALPGAPSAKNAAPDVNASPSPAVVSRILLNESVITFRWGKHALGPEANRDLEAVTQTLLRHPESTVEVAAHTDRTGPRDYNERLSRCRAHAVMSFLMEKGIEEIRIWWKGYGPSQPKIPDNTPAARAKNRRAEVRVWGYSM